MINVEFKSCGTGSYSPWHLNIARELNIPLMITSDIGWFVKIGEDIYRLRPGQPHKLHEYLTMLEEMNNKGEISDEEVLKELDDIVNNRNKDFYLEKCISLEEFRKNLIK